jgi:steroid delta-isomerase-like uncharacterized protein
VATDARTRTPAEVAAAVLAAFNLHDVEEVLRHAHLDCVDDFVVLGEFHGHEEIGALYREMFGAFPDFDLRVERIVGDDRTAAARWIAGGTFCGGPFQGIEPTGRRIEIRGLDFMEVEDGLVRRNTIYYDGASFAREVGLLPPRDSRRERALLAAFNARTRLASVVRRRR